MHILIISNYYPPHFIGGYELGCKDVVEGLREKGHLVAVLTSDYGVTEGHAEPGVMRSLRLKTSAKKILTEVQNVYVFVRILLNIRPDVIYFWNQTGLSYRLAPIGKTLGYRCLFYISDTSAGSWRFGAFLRRFLRSLPREKGLLARSCLVQGRSVIRRIHCQFASSFLFDRLKDRQDGRKTRDCVIHWGVDRRCFFPARGARRTSGATKVLYVGQIIPEKGVETAIEAIGLILAENQGGVSLTIVGGSSKPEYLDALKQRTRTDNLAGAITFAGKKNRLELVQIYQSHDILVLPSVWDEPFAITPLEAMSCGLALITTLTGGSREIFRDRQNCLVFPAGDAKACARAISELRKDNVLFEAIRQEGTREVARNFTLARMVERIDKDLKENAVR